MGSEDSGASPGCIKSAARGALVVRSPPGERRRDRGVGATDRPPATTAIITLGFCNGL